MSAAVRRKKRNGKYGATGIAGRGLAGRKTGMAAARLNARQKEVLTFAQRKEKSVLKNLKAMYEQALEGINERIAVMQAGNQTQSLIYRMEYQKTLKKQISAILDKLNADEYTSIEDYLTGAYADAYAGTMYDIAEQTGAVILTPIDQNAVLKAVQTDSKLKEGMYRALGVDVARLKKTIPAEISRGLAMGLSYHDMTKNIANIADVSYRRARTIVRTEAHRIQQASAEDARRVSKKMGADVVKQWDATLDGSTRDTHMALDGQIRETDEPFEMGGMKAMYPGTFGDPAQDCNCRCLALTVARWALDEERLVEMKERAEYFGLDKTESFAEFEKKYLKACQVLDTPGETGEKAVPYSERGIAIEERIKGYLKDLKEEGACLRIPKGSASIRDLAVLTTETGVEYTMLNIGRESVLIRGTEKGTNISKALYDELVKNKGTIEGHSHPFIGDLVPSEADINLIKMLTWQEESIIIEPSMKGMRYNGEGAIEMKIIAWDKSKNDYDQMIWGGE